MNLLGAMEGRLEEERVFGLNFSKEGVKEVLERGERNVSEVGTHETVFVQIPLQPFHNQFL